MATQLQQATRCERCQRVGYHRETMRILVASGTARTVVLCLRCIGDYVDLGREFMRGPSW